MNQNIIKIIVIIVFPWGLSCHCPCPCCEPQPTSASPGGPPLPLGWSLDLLWALWGQLRLWSGPTLMCACPQSPQLPELDWLPLWEHSSIQVFHRCRVYQADRGHLICGLCSWGKDFHSSSLVAPLLGLSCGFSPTSACGPPTGVCSRACPRALRSAPVRTGHRGGMASWVTGPSAVTGARVSQRPQAQVIQP